MLISQTGRESALQSHRHDRDLVGHHHDSILDPNQVVAKEGGEPHRERHRATVACGPDQPQQLCHRSPADGRHPEAEHIGVAGPVTGFYGFQPGGQEGAETD